MCVCKSVFRILNVLILCFQNGAQVIFLCGFFKFLTFLLFHHNFATIKVAANQRHIESYDQSNKETNTKQGTDYVKMLSKNGRIYSLGDMHLPTKKKIESDHAVANIRKCKEILKEHYLKRRSLEDIPQEGFKGPSFLAKTLSKKLLKIMEHNADRVVTVVGDVKSKAPMPDCLGEKRVYSASVLDQKPQPLLHLNRWNMKGPFSKSINNKNIRKNRKLKPY